MVIYDFGSDTMKVTHEKFTFTIFEDGSYIVGVDGHKYATDATGSAGIKTLIRELKKAARGLGVYPAKKSKRATLDSPQRHGSAG